MVFYVMISTLYNFYLNRPLKKGSLSHLLPCAYGFSSELYTYKIVARTKTLVIGLHALAKISCKNICRSNFLSSSQTLTLTLTLTLILANPKCRQFLFVLPHSKSVWSLDKYFLREFYVIKN